MRMEAITGKRESRCLRRGCSKLGVMRSDGYCSINCRVKDDKRKRSEASRGKLHAAKPTVREEVARATRIASTRMEQVQREDWAIEYMLTEIAAKLAKMYKLRDIRRSTTYWVTDTKRHIESLLQTLQNRHKGGYIGRVAGSTTTVEVQYSITQCPRWIGMIGRRKAELTVSARTGGIIRQSVGS